ncbi:MAG: methyltransferase domain-containing protein [Antarcticimicrobium sp.]|uniref:class I SAM-dependent DNA methyltransferase n=1 Tax=Antarcticimicrobium sp. TaxID=2824147 RepID=UPI00260BB653|nr:methyltransferase domain-containing protein [Antarcticimicrobium sp.]MDF1718454.1 methyltransferase domain-containing protein [Antarcticimicrobium sp.]
MSDESYLDKVYDARDAESTRRLYDDWAASYEDELTRNGYATPARCAAALAAHVPDLSAPILDFGCGTGLSGQALNAVGFTAIDGVDLSPDMLEVAREKDLYRRLDVIEAGAPLSRGGYGAICAAGVIGAGAAPVSIFDTLMVALSPGGRLMFSFNDHALAEPEYEDKIDSYLGAGKAELLFREHGPHLPGIGLGATVYVIAKT